MLGIMRRYKESIVIKFVFAIIVLSFIGTIFLVWGRGGDKAGGPSGFAAKVDGTKIGLDEYQKSYYRTRNLYEQIYGKSLTPDQEKAMGIKKMTLDNLIDALLVRKAAKEMGLKVSKDEVATEIAKIPAFQRNGAFDFNTYQQALKMNRMTPEQFEDAEQEDLLVQKARNQVKDKVTVTDQEVLAAFKKQNDKVDLQYVSFSPADVKNEVKLTDKDLEIYLQDHQAEFKTPEKIALAYAEISPAEYASKTAVTPEEAESYYRKNIDRYQGKGGILPFSEVKDQATADAKKAKASQAAYEKAADAANKFRNGGDIDQAAAAVGAKVEKTGLFTQAAPPQQLAGEKELIARAFTMKQGELGSPVETAKGIYLVKVIDRKPAAVPPLAEIKSAVEAKAREAKAAELAKKKAEDALAQLAKGGSNLKETGNFGYSPAGAIPTVGPSPELMEDAFNLTAAAPVAKKAYQVNGRWYAVRLKSRVDAPTTDLAKESEKIKQSLLPKKQQEALDKWVKDLRAKAKIEINPQILAD